jgi:DNA (cytosine-5)-methyltransferase 1
MVTFLDLFAGCGGFSSGLKAAGCEALAEVELDTWAADTLRANFPTSEVIEADIRTIPDARIMKYAGVDLIVGGPPCQGFSVAGSTQFGMADPRNELFYWFLHWIELLQPKIAIIENVPTILSKVQRGSTVLDAVRGRLSTFGYEVTAQILNAADFGAPQARRRAFIVATAPGVRFCFPQPTHASVRTEDLFGSAQPHTSVWDAIGDLPQIDAGEGTDDLVPYGSDASTDYQKRAREGSLGVQNHIAMRHTTRLIERFKVLKPGQALKDAPPEHGQIAKFTGERSKKPFGYNNYRLDPSKPALTIPASFQSLFLHPFLHRNLTAREAARLMGFPDNFVFKGKRTTMSWEKHLSQYNQIGNAVCPPVAEAIGRSAVEAIGKADCAVAQVVPLPRRDPLPLQRPEHLPEPCGIVSMEVRERLAALAKKWLGNDENTFTWQGLVVPVELLPAALIVASASECPICSPDAPPFGKHEGQICFLISKDDLHSLRENGQDHGLDYHLRAVFGVEHQVGHVVGDALERLGLVKTVELINERTGRRVRGMKVLLPSSIDASLHESLVSEFRRITQPVEQRMSAAGR